MKGLYEEIADVIRAARAKHGNPPCLEEVAMQIAHIFAETDQYFSYSVFLSMCEPEPRGGKPDESNG